MAAVAVASSPAEGTPHYFTLTVTGQLVRVVLSPLGTSPVQVARYVLVAPGTSLAANEPSLPVCTVATASQLSPLWR